MARVLVVDGEPDSATLVRQALEQLGHRVKTVGGGGDALAVVATSPPDVIVLDLVLPDVDGWTVLRELKSSTRDAGGEIPVVLYTTRCEPLDRARGAIEGAVAHFAKAGAVDDVGAAVDDVLRAPEPELRRRAQERALADLARLEGDGDSDGTTAAGFRLSALERERGRTSVAQLETVPTRDVAANLDQLTDKQRALLEALRRAPTVMEAAGQMQMSRSNVYASLRRIGRTLGTRSVTELLDVVRRGELV